MAHAAGVKKPRWEVESHRGPLPNNSTLGGQVGWRLITGPALPSCGGAEFQVQAGLHDIDVGSDIDWKRRHRPDWTGRMVTQARLRNVSSWQRFRLTERGGPASR